MPRSALPLIPFALSVALSPCWGSLTWDSEQGYSDTQGANGWYYQYWDSADGLYHDLE